MSLKIWDGSGWVKGSVGVSPGDDDPLVTGTVRMWPWSGAQDLIDNLRYPVFVANRFGKDEWPGNTGFAAGQLFSSEVLQPVLPRLVGHCDLQKLSGETGINSLVLSYDAPAETTASAWNSKTIASPLVGGTAQPASFWDNSTYPSKSVGPAWVGKQPLAVRIRSTACRDPLVTWLTDNNALNDVVVITETYSDATNMAANGVKVLFEVNTGFPGNGTVAAPDTMFGLGIYGVLMPAGNTNVTIVNNCRIEGLKFWTYVVDTSALARSYAQMGVEGIFTNLPSTVAPVPLPPNPDPVPPDPVDPPVDPPTDPPANIGTWFGWGNDTGTQPTGISALMNAGLDAPGIVRHFTGNGTASGLSSSVLSSGYNLWVSWKPSITSATGMQAPNNWVPSSMTYLKQHVGKNAACFMCVWHEPEGNRPAELSLATYIKRWQDAQAALWDACVTARAEGYKFYVAPIICDWTFTDTSKGSASQWYSADFTKYDLMGFDVYPVGQKASGSNMIARLGMVSDYVVKPYADITRRDTYMYNRRCAELARQRNRPWGSGETGLLRGAETGGDTQYKYSKVQRATRFREITNDLLSLPNPPRLWCWYNHGGCTVTTEPDLVSMAAWNESVATNPTTRPRP